MRSFALSLQAFEGVAMALGLSLCSQACISASTWPSVLQNPSAFPLFRFRRCPRHHRPSSPTTVQKAWCSVEARATSSSTAQVSGMDIARVRFNDGSPTVFSQIVNGCWTLAGGHGRIVEAEILEVMDLYARNGLNTFDTADIYGPAKEFWVFTKLVPNIFQNKPTPQFVEQSIRKSMSALGVSKLDLVQLHWWDYSVPDMVGVAKALTDLKEKGLITSIGTTNMNTEALAQIVDAGVPVVCNQVQFSLLDQRPRKMMLAYCKERDIKLLTYGTLAGGLLSDSYVEQGRKVKSSTPDLSTSSLKMYWRIVREAGGEEHWRKVLVTVAEVAASHGVSVANVALRWAMQQGPVHPIVGLRNSKHLQDNLKAFSFTLSEADMDKIEGVLAEGRGPQRDCFDMERG